MLHAKENSYYPLSTFCITIKLPTIKEFKQITTAGATTVAVTETVWGEYVSAGCQILVQQSDAKSKDKRNIG